MESKIQDHMTPSYVLENLSGLLLKFNLDAFQQIRFSLLSSAFIQYWNSSHYCDSPFEIKTVDRLKEAVNISKQREV
jgi:hypothetical protein